MKQANRKKYRSSPGKFVRMGVFTELIESLAKPRPAFRTFVRPDGARITFCDSVTVDEPDDFNRRVSRNDYGT